MFYQRLVLGGFESRHKITQEFLYHCQKYIDLRMEVRTGNALHHPIHPTSSCLAVSAHVTSMYLVKEDSIQSGLQCQLFDGAYVDCVIFWRHELAAWLTWVNLTAKVHRQQACVSVLHGVLVSQEVCLCCMKCVNVAWCVSVTRSVSVLHEVCQCCMVC